MLRGGGYVVFRGVGLTFRATIPSTPTAVGTTLHVRAESAWEPANLTRAKAKAEIEAAQHLIDQLRRESPDFDQVIGGFPIDYELLYDYGMGATRLCSLVSGEMRWSSLLKE